VASSGAEDPAAIKVAPATSGGILRTEKKVKTRVSYKGFALLLVYAFSQK